MTRAIAFAVSMCLASAAQAADWAHFATCGGPGGIRLYSYDKSSVQTQGDNKLVSVRGDYSQVQGSRSKEARIRWSVNCRNRTFVELSRTEFQSNRTILADYATPTGAMGISPSSAPQKLFQQVCA